MTDHHLKISNKLRATKKSFNSVKAENSQGKGLRGCYRVRNWLVSFILYCSKNIIFPIIGKFFQNGHFYNYFTQGKALEKFYSKKKYFLGKKV